MKARLIVNPAAGRDTAPDYLSSINSTLRRTTGFLDIVMTTGDGDATALAAQAVRDGVDRLFVAGGDGTLNEAINGVAEVEGGLEQIVFGVIPLGTGNDFATAIGMPDDVEAAAEVLTDASVRGVDVGTLNGRAFINVSAGGFIAEVSDAVDTQLKSIAGRFAYLLGGAQVVFSFEPVSARITVDGTERQRDLHTFAVCNSKLIGGGRLIAPHARVDDGLLDICIIPAMATVEFVALLRRVAEGAHLEDDRVEYVQASRADFTFSRRVKVNTDGQVLEAERCAYDLRPRAARFLSPAL
jgi:diacylglycerol kinase (ATP)